TRRPFSFTSRDDCPWPSPRQEGRTRGELRGRQGPICRCLGDVPSCLSGAEPAKTAMRLNQVLTNLGRNTRQRGDLGGCHACRNLHAENREPGARHHGPGSPAPIHTRGACPPPASGPGNRSSERPANANSKLRQSVPLAPRLTALCWQAFKAI